jgi:hypothetical protein
MFSPRQTIPPLATHHSTNTTLTPILRTVLKRFHSTSTVFAEKLFVIFGRISVRKHCFHFNSLRYRWMVTVFSRQYFLSPLRTFAVLCIWICHQHFCPLQQSLGRFHTADTPRCNNLALHCKDMCHLCNDFIALLSVKEFSSLFRYTTVCLTFKRISPHKRYCHS